jgi:hypothetical protein
MSMPQRVTITKDRGTTEADIDDIRCLVDASGIPYRLVETKILRRPPHARIRLIAETSDLVRLSRVVSGHPSRAFTLYIP